VPIVSSFALPDAARGSIVTYIGNNVQFVKPSADQSVLTCQANSADGTGLQWVTSLKLLDLQTTTLEVGQTVTVGINVSVTYGLGVFGVTPPTSQPVFPGTAAGSDATVINAIVAILSGAGLCASS